VKVAYFQENSDFSRAETFSDLSQIFCQAKISEIPQSTLYLHQSTEFENNEITHDSGYICTIYGKI
jgi:hypothetical protein